MGLIRSVDIKTQLHHLITEAADFACDTVDRVMTIPAGADAIRDDKPKLWTFEHFDQVVSYC